MHCVDAIQFPKAPAIAANTGLEAMPLQEPDSQNRNPNALTNKMDPDISKACRDPETAHKGTLFFRNLAFLVSAFHPSLKNRVCFYSSCLSTRIQWKVCWGTWVSRSSSFCSPALSFIIGLFASICSFSRDPLNTYHVVSTEERKMKAALWICIKAVHSSGKSTCR